MRNAPGDGDPASPTALPSSARREAVRRPRLLKAVVRLLGLFGLSVLLRLFLVAVSRGQAGHFALGIELRASSLVDGGFRRVVVGEVASEPDVRLLNGMLGEKLAAGVFLVALSHVNRSRVQGIERAADNNLMLCAFISRCFHGRFGGKICLEG